MGSGDRIKYGVVDPIQGLGLGISVSRFPFTVTVSLHVLCWFISIGFGKGYDE
jgi:hypothetical protein